MSATITAFEFLGNYYYSGCPECSGQCFEFPAENVAGKCIEWPAFLMAWFSPASSANWTRSQDESDLGFNADAVVHGTSNPLLAAEVALGRLD